MSDTASPHDDDPAAEDQATEDHAGDGQQAADSRIGGSLFQIRGVGGNVSISDTQPRHSRRRGAATLAVVAAAATAATVAVGIGVVAWVRPSHSGSTERATRASSPQSPLSVATAVNPVQPTRARNVKNAFVFNVPATKLPPLPSGYVEDHGIIESWGYRNGGIDANYTDVQMVVQGNAAKSVVLTDLRIKVLRRTAPPRATYVKVFPGADGVDGRGATVDLDKPGPTLESMYNFSGDGEGDSWSFPLRVSRTEVEVIGLEGRTRRYDCQWVAEVHFVSDGKPGVITINNNGSPFRTVSSVNSAPHTVKNGRVVPGDPDVVQ